MQQNLPSQRTLPLAVSPFSVLLLPLLKTFPLRKQPNPVHTVLDLNSYFSFVSFLHFSPFLPFFPHAPFPVLLHCPLLASSSHSLVIYLWERESLPRYSTVQTRRRWKDPALPSRSLQSGNDRHFLTSSIVLQPIYCI